MKKRPRGRATSRSNEGSQRGVQGLGSAEPQGHQWATRPDGRKEKTHRLMPAREAAKQPKRGGGRAAGAAQGHHRPHLHRSKLFRPDHRKSLDQNQIRPNSWMGRLSVGPHRPHVIVARDAEAGATLAQACVGTTAPQPSFEQKPGAADAPR